MHHGDPTFARFADVFHHRLLSLFYRAWAQGQPTANLDRDGEDRFGAYVGSLIGLDWAASAAAASSARSGRSRWKFHAEFHHAGLLSRQVRNADGLAALLTSYLRRPVRVEQFAGAWMQLQTEERTRIGLGGARGNKSASLGRTAVLGSMVWDRQHHFRLHVGGLTRSDFDSLLPEGEALPGVIALVEQYVGIEFGWDLRLQLKAAEAGEVEPVPRPPLPAASTKPGPGRLGRQSRLGWTSWLGMKGRVDDVVLVFKPNTARSALKSGRLQPAPAN